MNVIVQEIASLLPVKFELRQLALNVIRHLAVFAVAIAILRVVFDLLVGSLSARAWLLYFDNAMPPYLVFALCGALALYGWVKRRQVRPDLAATRHPLADAALDVLQLVLITLLFGIPFVRSAWQLHGDVMMAGRFPYSDAHGYFDGAGYVSHVGKLDLWCQRRPINALLLATRLGFSGGSLHGATLIQIGLLAAAVLVLARTLARDLGVGAGLFVVVMLSRFSDEHGWTTMSEALGLTLGSLALAVLWIGARERRPLTAMAGIVLMTTACNARAGPQLVLPLLAIWMGFAWRGEKYFNFTAFGKGCAAIVLGMVLNAALLFMYGDGAGMGQGNFSLTLYGYARGSANWGRIYTDYPEARTMPEPELHRFCYAKAFESIRNEPGLFLRGLKNGAIFFATDFRLYANQMFRVTENRFFSIGIKLLIIAGLFRMLFLLRREPASTMLLAVALGMLLSAPIVYPDGWYRVLMVAYPALVALGALGIAGLRRRPDIMPPPVFSWHKQQAGILTAVLIAGAFILPALFHLLNPARLIDPLPGGSNANAVVRIGPGSPELEILAPGTPAPTIERQVRDEDYNTYLPEAGYVDTPKNESGGRLRGPVFVTHVYNLQKDRPGLLHVISEQRIVPDAWSTLELAGRFEQQNSLRVFFVKPPLMFEGSRVIGNPRFPAADGPHELSFDAPTPTELLFAPALKTPPRLSLRGELLAGAQIVLKSSAGVEVKLETKDGSNVSWEIAAGLTDIASIVLTPRFNAFDVSQVPLHLLERPFELAPGVCRKVALPKLAARSDDLEAPEELILYEDGKPMAPKGHPPKGVYSVGFGRYCLWDGELFITASDNGDLNTNGREYAYRMLPRPFVQRRLHLIFGR